MFEDFWLNFIGVCCILKKSHEGGGGGSWLNFE